MFSILPLYYMQKSAVIGVIRVICGKNPLSKAKRIFVYYVTKWWKSLLSAAKKN